MQRLTLDMTQSKHWPRDWRDVSQIQKYEIGKNRVGAMIDRAHDLPISKQAEALGISRGSVYYVPRPVPDTDLVIMRRLDRLHLEHPFAGSRMARSAAGM
jgi:hypothetical protein